MLALGKQYCDFVLNNQCDAVLDRPMLVLPDLLYFGLPLTSPCFVVVVVLLCYASSILIPSCFFFFCILGFFCFCFYTVLLLFVFVFCSVFSHLFEVCAVHFLSVFVILTGFSCQLHSLSISGG